VRFCGIWFECDCSVVARQRVFGTLQMPQGIA
jgi:hypothetical protein